MRIRTLLGVFVATLMAFPLHAQSETQHNPPSLIDQAFAALSQARAPDDGPGMMTRIFAALDDARDKALEVATRAVRDVDPTRDDQG